MGRKKHQNPTRDEKERIRKKRTLMFKRAAQTAVEKDVDVFLVFRYRDDLFCYNSARDSISFPPTKEEITATGIEQDTAPQSSDNSESLERPPDGNKTSPLRSGSRAPSVSSLLCLPPPPVLEKSPIVDSEGFMDFNVLSDLSNLDAY
ncbi:MAG: hypothetical protein MMC23_006301 [Stictis urceolatum]|nr:hypothetical protein [Stictis urceolata]